MTRLPILSGKEVVKALTKIGYYVRNQRGSHIHLRHPIHPPLTIPNHREVARGTLKAIIRDSGLTTDEFMKLL